MSTQRDIMHGVTKHHNKLKSLLKPLEQYYGVNDIIYFESNSQGEMLNLSSNIDLACPLYG